MEWWKNFFNSITTPVVGGQVNPLGLFHPLTQQGQQDARIGAQNRNIQEQMGRDLSKWIAVNQAAGRPNPLLSPQIQSQAQADSAVTGARSSEYDFGQKQATNQQISGSVGGLTPEAAAFLQRFIGGNINNQQAALNYGVSYDANQAERQALGMPGQAAQTIANVDASRTATAGARADQAAVAGDRAGLGAAGLPQSPLGLNALQLLTGNAQAERGLDIREREGQNQNDLGWMRTSIDYDQGRERLELMRQEMEANKQLGQGRLGSDIVQNYAFTPESARPMLQEFLKKYVGFDVPPSPVDPRVAAAQAQAARDRQAGHGTVQQARTGAAPAKTARPAPSGPGLGANPMAGRGGVAPSPNAAPAKQPVRQNGGASGSWTPAPPPVAAPAARQSAPPPAQVMTPQQQRLQAIQQLIPSGVYDKGGAWRPLLQTDMWGNVQPEATLKALEKYGAGLVDSTKLKQAKEMIKQLTENQGRYER